MKAKLLYLFASAVMIGLFAGLIAVPVRASTTNYHLEMWIAPLECTRNEVSDGVTTNVILTPQQCNELLNPVGSPGNSGGGAVSVPRAPDTGVFRDRWTTIMTVVVFAAFTSSIIALIIRDLRIKRLKIGRH